ncbi:ABC transporter permease subunit [Cryobacterium arcticum]|uniref:ABC transporter permease n=1 Tax=Cryobacterium arcticum TaxID=670052 RepID=A0A1B1BN66_9MICO|nr:ABC transporter permease subunit [Cryobacterium arcticum]ANP74004.1 ABC transporter permease [Cryobacterium arcticum]
MSAATATSPRTSTEHRSALPIFTKTLTDGWRSLLGWSIGLTAALCLYLPIFPSLGGNPQMQQLIDSLPTELTRTINYQQIDTGAGYTQSTFFGLIGFLLICIAAISWGAAAIGGDEESGQLELTLAHGVTRVQVAVQRFAALVVKVLALALVAFLVVLFWNGPAGLDIDVANLAVTCLLFGGLALVCGSTALVCGALTGRKVWGIGGGAAVAVIGYVFNAIANQSADLEWLHGLSPYYAAFGHSPLANGTDAWTLVLFYLAVLVLGGLAALVLRQKDVGA